VDGSTHDSVWEQVFDYNGFGRYGSDVLLRESQAGLRRTLTPTEQQVFQLSGSKRSWSRLLVKDDGLDAGWLVPISAGALLALLVSRRRRPRRDPVRAATILWGSWFLTFFVALSAASDLHQYYEAALSPAVAALCGIGASQLWLARRRAGFRRALWVGVAAAVGASTVYATWLVVAQGGPADVYHRRVPGALPVAIVSLGVAAVVLCLVLCARRGGRRLGALTVGLIALALLVGPAVASGWLTEHELGFFDAPFESSAATYYFHTQWLEATNVSPARLANLRRERDGAQYLIAGASWQISYVLWATGSDVLPVGGYTGFVDRPSAAELTHLVDSGRLHLVLVPPGGPPSLRWLEHAHCRMYYPVPADDAAQYAQHDLRRIESAWWCTPAGTSTASG
jgi:4-amino-4-deoxy-L-arabinose transferase-like glycosyltransferase